MYIYIYIYRERDICIWTNMSRCRPWASGRSASGFGAPQRGTAYLHTEILDFGGFDSSRILISRGGILMSMGHFWKL